MEDLIKQSILFYQEKKFKEVINILEPIINEVNDYQVLFNYGKSLILSNNNNGINYILKSLEYNPNNIQVLQEIVLFYIEQRDYEKANKYIDYILKIEPNNISVLFLKRTINNFQSKINLNKIFEAKNDNSIINTIKNKINLLIDIGIYNEYSDLFEDKTEFWDWFFISKKLDESIIEKLIQYLLLIFDDKSLEESLLIIDYLEIKNFAIKDELYLAKIEIYAHVLGNVKEAINISKNLLDKSKPKEIIFRYLKFLLFFYYCDDYSISDYISFSKWFNEIPENKNIYINFLNKNNQKIKVGYLSPDFKKHPIYYFLSLIYLNHNKDEFEIFSYNLGENKDEITDFYKNNCNYFKDIYKLNNKEIADIIHKDKIDILIDISAFVEKDRILILSYKPAPVQISMIGSHISTSLDTVDYKLLDKYLSKNVDNYFSEKIIDIPDTMFCYKPKNDLPEITELNYLKNNYLTFGSFNHGSKINETTIKFWSKVMNNYENSKIIIKCEHSKYSLFRERILTLFKKYNIEENRVNFYNQIQGTYNHLDFYNNIDIALDTYPYNGVTTTFESLVMGVPVLTLTGNIVSARTGKSILTNLGMSNWVINNLENQIIIDLDNLDNLRKNLRKNLLSSILCDHKGFTLKLENIYKQILRR